VEAGPAGGTALEEPAAEPAALPAAGAAGGSGGEEAPGDSLWIFIVLGVLILLVLGIITLSSTRRLRSSPHRAMVRAASGPPPKMKAKPAASPAPGGKREPGSPSPAWKPLPKDLPVDEHKVFEGPLMLKLFVEDQNTAIGRRNIHSVKPGTVLTLGGGKSDFLIFLVPVPPKIAQVVFDGKQCTLVPLKPQYFPDSGSRQIPNCIGKNIRIITDRNYELHIRIEQYEDPLIALNKLLNSVTVGG
jgi:hypothetical protein